ncbi:MAG TPA: hypothetical protein VEY10_19360 [Flavisolibacter sp.]|jgi:hypothetical protein|nr:hypothetical protein [Flavisolibacter sp.]
MPEKQIQEYLFQRIKEALPPGRPLVETIAEVLHISHDSAYRRIRGETLLVLEEAKILCQQYAISLDQLLALKGNSVVFENVEMDHKATDFKTYLTGILQRLKDLNSFNHKNIVYLTKDLPVFYQFCYKPVFAFRYFSWMKALCRHQGFVPPKFLPDCLPPDIEALGAEIISIYSKIPSVEIWNRESINNILQQISHCREAGVVTESNACEVYDGLRKTLEHLQTQAEHGCKFLPGEDPRTKKQNFQLFYNRVGLGENIILTTYDDRKALYFDYDILNYLTTTDETFCNGAHQRMQTIMQKSTLISSSSERQRTVFFNLLYARLPRCAINKKKLV